MNKDTLKEPIEYICATYTYNGLKNILPTLTEPCNITSIIDELTMRMREAYPEAADEDNTWDSWDFLGRLK